MSLRVRLTLLIVALVALVAVALSALYLDSLVNSLSGEAIERSRVASQQISAFLIDHFNAQSESYEAPANVEDTKGLWYQIVSSDRDVNAMLVKVMAPFPSIVEINVASEDGRILASSNELRIGTTLTKLRDFSQWSSEPLIRRATDVVARQLEWEVVSATGNQGLPAAHLSVQHSDGHLQRAPAARASAGSGKTGERWRAGRFWPRW